MPTLASWLASGSHRLVGWECDIPSMTTGSQAGILHGDNHDIPAFYWYEKRERRLMSSANPRDLHARPAAALQRPRTAPSRRRQRDQPLQRRRRAHHHDGRHPDRRRRWAQRRATGLLRVPAQSVQPVPWARRHARRDACECWQAVRQKLENVRPRIRRFGLFTIQRGATNVVLRDATTWAVVASMYRGRHIIYCDYLGYDEVAHYAGPETRDAVATLASIDRQLRQLARAAQRGAASVSLRRALGPRPDDCADLRSRLRKAPWTR